MLTEFTIEMQYVVYSIAVWRLTHLLVAEDGPWDVVFYLRKKLGNSVAGKAMDCFYCLSMWMAIPFAFVISSQLIMGFVCWISLSGGACLLEQFTTQGNKDNNITSK